MGFVKRMIEDSLTLQKRIVWYTCMLGKKSSLQAVLACLREHKILTTRTTTFVQGKTLRWGVAWSFFHLAPSDPKDTVFGAKKEARRKNDRSFLVEGVGEEVCERVTAWLQELPPKSVYWERHDNETKESHTWVVSGHLSTGWKQHEGGGGKNEGGGSSGSSSSSSKSDGGNNRSKKRTVDGDPVLTAPVPLFNFVVSVEQEHEPPTTTTTTTTLGPADVATAAPASAVSSAVAVYKVTALFGAPLATDQEPRREFWQFVDCLTGEVTRSTRRWRRKLAKAEGAKETQHK